VARGQCAVVILVLVVRGGGAYDVNPLRQQDALFGNHGGRRTDEPDGARWANQENGHRPPSNILEIRIWRIWQYLALYTRSIHVLLSNFQLSISRKESSCVCMVYPMDLVYDAFGFR